jgi:hypothetical protein
MDPKQKIEELERKRAERLSELDSKETEQRVTDLEGREAVEEQHGLVAAVSVARYVPGFPTCAYVRTPTSLEYKRYVEQIGKAVEKKSTKSQRDASELLAKSCWVYPETSEAKTAMLDRFPGLLTPIGMAAAALAEGKAEDEGKG